MMRTKGVFLSLSLLFSLNMYGVHAHTIRYNNACLTNEQRGNPDVVDAHIFKHKAIVNYEHILATSSRFVEARKEVIESWRSWTLSAMETRLQELEAEAATTGESDTNTVARAAYARLTALSEHLQRAVYQDLSNDLIAMPEQDIVLLMQWAERIIVTGDEIVPVVTVVLDDTHALTASSCCGDLPFVLNDHIYWQKVIEAGWVAVSPDSLGRVQPVLHTNVVGDKFHFYKTKFGVFFRETLGADEKTPGDLVRIMKYFANDPRHTAAIHG